MKKKFLSTLAAFLTFIILIASTAIPSSAATGNIYNYDMTHSTGTYLSASTTVRRTGSTFDRMTTVAYLDTAAQVPVSYQVYFQVYCGVVYEEVPGTIYYRLISNNIGHMSPNTRYTANMNASTTAGPLYFDQTKVVDYIRGWSNISNTPSTSTTETAGGLRCSIKKTIEQLLELD